MTKPPPAGVRAAETEAKTCGLPAVNALHVAAAKMYEAQEFVTVEKPTTAVFRITGLSVVSLSP